MKFVTLALIGLFAVAAAAQNNTTQKADLNQRNPEISNLQIGCPVAFTEVALKTQARYMPVQYEAGPDNSLAFEYKNKSGKKVESILVRVELTVKRNIYDLDATTITRYMTLTEDSSQVLPLNLITYAVGPVTLEQVTYTDGDTWTPGTNKNCRYLSQRSTEQIGSAK